MRHHPYAKCQRRRTKGPVLPHPMSGRFLSCIAAGRNGWVAPFLNDISGGRHDINA